MMAHKARVLPGEKTIRLHYANWFVILILYFQRLVTLYQSPLAIHIMVISHFVLILAVLTDTVRSS